MLDLFTLTKPLLHRISPETAHNLGLFALKTGLLPAPKSPIDPALTQKIFGLEFKNPIGLAAGFDKNAVAINPLLKQGFGFVETGTVTPLPQTGNPAPRIFRLPEDRAVINRLGFNNHGLAGYVANFAKRDKKLGIAGANIGKNKDTKIAEDDYEQGLSAVYPLADYITINISSPNTVGLRDLQHREALSNLLAALATARARAEVTHKKYVPILLKIAPDIDNQECEDIAEAVTANGIDGIIISNTTISRPDCLRGTHRAETGGLSGAPLFLLATERLKYMYKITGGKIPIIGVGGVSSAEDAYQKILAGAALVQLYTALVYQGFALVREINAELPKLLARDGFSHISEAVGKGNAN